MNQQGFNDFLKNIGLVNYPFNLYTAENEQEYAVFIGPEGGFEQEEIELATAAGIEPVTLGRRILRTETAGLTVLSWLMYHLES